MKVFEKILLSIVMVPVCILFYILMAVVCLAVAIVAAPFALIYGLVYFVYIGLVDVWKGELYAD